MKKIFPYILFFILYSSALSGQGSKMQALFIYNFTKNIEWPPTSTREILKIGVLGQESIFEEINSLLKGKQSGSRNIQIIYYNSMKEIPDCQVLYITNEKSDLFYEVYSKLKNKSVLIITNKPGMIEKGACINFTIKEGKQAYEISKKNIENQNLLVSLQIINMGTVK